MVRGGGIFYSACMPSGLVARAVLTPKEKTMQRHATKLATLAALTLGLITTAAQAEAVRTEKNMSLELANQIAARSVAACAADGYAVTATVVDRAGTDRKSTRLNSSHLVISYAVFCLKKKKQYHQAVQLIHYSY